MRQRSDGILAENIDDYITQLNTKISNTSPYSSFIPLCNFDRLSLTDTSNSLNKENENNNDVTDLLSFNLAYQIKFSEKSENLVFKDSQKILIPMKCKRIQKKRRGLITHHLPLSDILVNQ